jgi:transposase
MQVKRLPNILKTENMNNLPVHQVNVINQLPEAARKIVSAKFLEPKCGEIKVNELEYQISILITNLLTDAGHKNDAQDKSVLLHLTTRVSEDMKTRFKHITLGELKIALNEGVRGVYGTFMGINITTINNWIKAFEGSEMRKMALTDYNQRLTLEQPKAELSQAEIDKIIWNGCINAYEDFLKEGKLPYSTKPIYERLKKEFNIKWTEAERAEINKEAELIYKSKLKAEFKKVGETEAGLLLEKKRTALKYYFNKLKSEGVKTIKKQVI